jgi:mitochondrial chaperone BCS1
MDLGLLLPLIGMMNKDGSVWAAFAICLFHILMTHQKTIFKAIKKHLPSFTRYTKYSITANISYKHNSLYDNDYSDEFLAILRILRTLLLSSSKRKVDYKIVQYPRNHENVVFFELKSPIKLTDNITVLTETINEKSEKIEYEYVKLEIVLLSKSYNHLEEFVRKALAEYKKERSETVKDPHIFIFNSYDADLRYLTYDEYPFTTTKSFENMFFEEKENVLKKVDQFMHNEANYLRLGIPYTQGYLLYGPPGTGKTSFIKSLARYTGRHIVNLPTKNVKTIECLKKIFLTEEIKGARIPNRKRLYVLEDIDCGDWRNVVMSRDSVKDEPNEVKKHDVLMVEMLSKINGNKEETHEKKRRFNDTNDEKMNITLADFLDLLDGIIEIPGRMLVMTTNHPELIDSALMRPGRIDVLLEFRKLTRKNVRDMYMHWFDRDIPEHVFDGMKDYTFTQAEIGNLFSSHNQKHILSQLLAHT